MKAAGAQSTHQTQVSVNHSTTCSTKKWVEVANIAIPYSAESSGSTVFNSSTYQGISSIDSQGTEIDSGGISN